MRTGFTMLVGVGALSLAFGVGSATAATRHYQHHAVKSQNVQAQAPREEFNALSTSGNNPAKRYPTRQISDGAVKTGTLNQSGNNPAKRYPSRQISQNAMTQPTLMTSGNNPAKRYTASR